MNVYEYLKTIELLKEIIRDADKESADKAAQVLRIIRKQLEE